jgi:hypothetical protein
VTEDPAPEFDTVAVTESEERVGETFHDVITGGVGVADHRLNLQTSSGETSRDAMFQRSRGNEDPPRASSTAF